MTTNSIYSRLPQYLRLKTGRLKTIANAIDNLTNEFEDNIQFIHNQFFLTSAEGKYLLNLAKSQGFELNTNSTLDYDALSIIIPTLFQNPKLIKQSLVNLLEVFYENSKNYANLTSALYEPFVCAIDDTLTIDNGITSYTFDIYNNINDNTSITAAEIVNIINSSSQNVCFAEVFTLANKNYVKIYSTEQGINSKLKISGGLFQNNIKFPIIITTIPTSTSIKFTKTAVYNPTLRLTFNYNILTTKANDIIFIKGTNIPYLDGSYIITNVGLDNSGKTYIEVNNLLYQDPTLTTTGVTITSSYDYIIQNATYNIIQECVFISEINNILNIQLLAVPNIIKKNLRNGCYLDNSFIYNPYGINSPNLKNQKILNKTDILAGMQINEITISAVSGFNFDTSGKCVIGLATEKQEVIEYINIVNNIMYLKNGTLFHYNHDINDEIIGIYSEEAFIPNVELGNKASYLTDSVIVRSDLLFWLDKYISAGAQVNITIVYPDIKYTYGQNIFI